MNKGWPVTRLGNLTDLVTKGTTPTSIGHEFVEEGINFVKVESITTTGQFIEEKFAHITPACYTVLGRSQLQAGDILFSIAGALGRTGYVTDDILPANTNQALAIIRLKREVGLYPKFVLKALETGVVLEQIEKFKGGVAQQNLSLAQVRDFQIPLPPLAEQQRIVGLLDEAFEGLATAKANAEKNLQNARALFESHLQSVFTQRGEGWVEKPFEDCIEDVKYTTKIQRKDFLEEGEFPIVSQEAEFTNGYWDNAADVFKVTRPVVIFGDHTQVLKYIDFDFVLGADGVKLLPPKPFLNPKFFFYALRSAPLKSLGYARHYRLLKELQIGYPDMNTQVAIAKKLDALEAETQRLARLYERKLAALEELKKSLLHQAFSGEL
jgi:type I restriction enzyme S subunit